MKSLVVTLLGFLLVRGERREEERTPKDLDLPEEQDLHGTSTEPPAAMLLDGEEHTELTKD